jgi:hypothetical protein
MKHFSMVDHELASIANEQLVLLQMKDHTVFLTFICLHSSKIVHVVSYEAVEMLTTPVLHLSFDSHYSNTTESYNIAITFSKLGSMLGDSGYIKLYVYSNSLPVAQGLHLPGGD